MKSDVLAVVVSYNNPAPTYSCIEALLNQDHPVDVVVWDNASFDGTPAMLKEFGDKITTILSPENRLWTPPINTVARNYLDTHPYLMFMNNDIILPPDAVEKMKETLDTIPDAGMTAPWGSRLGGQQDRASSSYEGTDPVRVSYVVGACVMVKSFAWLRVGELDERMPLGADDHDYCIRMKHDGFGVYVTRSFEADHLGHASSWNDEGQKSWQDWGGYSWEQFNTKWAGYYRTEDEAVRGHWSGIYHPDVPRGTGWDDETYDLRVRQGIY